ncbi:MAG TPA: FAD-binding protein, partial [Microlunatus sp.]|nr:FAD-binding protein [Microlunatus sp.]
MTGVKHMKWWGWGVEGVAFHHEDKPAFAPFVRDKVGLDITGEPVVPPELESLPVPVPKLTDAFLAQLVETLGEEHVHTETLDRIVHTYGKSLRDLVRLRRAIIPRIPDAVLYPADEEQVRAIVDLAIAEDVVIIPFGGGTNISGS